MPDKLAAGVRYLNDYHDWRERRLSLGFAEAGEMTAEQAEAVKALAAGGGSLSEYDSKALIRAFGVPTTREEIAGDTEAAVAAAERIGYPVALKVNSPDILHKTEAGGIRLGFARRCRGSDGVRRGGRKCQGLRPPTPGSTGR